MRDLKGKHFSLLFVLLSLLIVNGACGNKNIVTEMPTGTEQSKESPGETYGFTSFDLVIDTRGMKGAILVGFDESSDRTEATYENKIDNLYLNGNKAMDKLNTIFEELALEPDMDDEDMVKQVAETFEIKDYKRLKLKIKFKGHDEKQLTFTK